jgi:hypothetical protein
MRFVWMAGVCLLALCTPTQGQTMTDRNHAALTHVRGTTAALQALIADTAAKSPAFRAMLDRLEASTVIVYVRIAPLPTLSWMAEPPSSRWTRRHPTRACWSSNSAAAGRSSPRPRRSRTNSGTRIEIADAPWVIGAETLERYYRANRISPGSGRLSRCDSRRSRRGKPGSRSGGSWPRELPPCTEVT